MVHSIRVTKRLTQKFRRSWTEFALDPLRKTSWTGHWLFRLTTTSPQCFGDAIESETSTRARPQAVGFEGYSHRTQRCPAWQRDWRLLWQVQHQQRHVRVQRWQRESPSLGKQLPFLGGCFRTRKTLLQILDSAIAMTMTSL